MIDLRSRRKGGYADRNNRLGMNSVLSRHCGRNSRM